MFVATPRVHIHSCGTIEEEPPYRRSTILDQVGGGVEGVNDDFPDAHLFRIAILSEWYKSIGEYLSNSKFPR